MGDIKETLIKEIQYHEGRAAYWRNTTSDEAFGWNTAAMAEESEARVKSAKELLKSL